MFRSLFRKKIPTLPVSTAELSAALRVAQQFADGESAKLEYGAAADALDRAITHTRKYADAPTRDALAYALGRAELNLKDELRELIEVGRETHMLVQGVHVAQSEQGAAVAGLRATFQQFSEQLSLRIGGLEQRMDASEADRKNIHEAIGTLNTRHGGQISELIQRLSAIEELLEVSGGHEAGG